MKRRVRMRRVALVVALALAGAGTAWALSSRSDDDASATRGVPVRRTSRRSIPTLGLHRPTRISVRSIGELPAAVQDAVAAPLPGGSVLLAGGLTPADLSTAVIVRIDRGHFVRTVGRLPVAVHDAAAVTIGRAVYLFGGGDGVRQHDEILRLDPRTGHVTQAGRLPQPSSDQSAAEIHGTAYVVGGYTGSRWLDSIVAWRPGTASRVVAHLPVPLRYAATTAAAGRLVVAGGSRPDGTASDVVFAYTPRGKLVRLARLPAPTTHAAAASLGSTVYVVGGRGSGIGSARAGIVAVDPLTRRVHLAGRLPAPLSDLAAVSLGDRIEIVGGRGTGGTVATLQLAHETTAPVAAANPPPARVPALVDAADVYAADTPNGLRGAARLALPRIYVPNSKSDTVDVIDPRRYRVVGHFAVGGLPQHVVPAYDLRTLYVTNDTGNNLTTIDPRTGRPGRTIRVDDPYNMYFTPDGRFAIVVAEALHRLDFRDAHTFGLHRSLAVPCSGVDHVDFTADGRLLLASCEFSGELLVVDVQRERVAGTIALRSGAMPQDVKLAPDGRLFYVADMAWNGLWKIDARRLRVVGFLPTGRGAHGLYPSRDARFLYVSNRNAGTVSVVSFATGRVVRTWRIPGGSPDMGGVSADGRVLWLSGRYNAEVYAIDTRTGRLLRRIPVGAGPHGLAVWPQPGRYSLGHTGIMR